MKTFTDSIVKYTCAFGVFELPKDVYLRSLRDGYGTAYLDKWCQFQYEKKLAGL
jgi:hypothetical protein